MPIIYFDNFRGFKKTFLDLKEVNFFVGENSTGKTSVLKLIGILSSQGFWRYGDFGKHGTSLGGFNDIITSTKDNYKEYIELGILGDESDISNESIAIRLRFIERDNFPFIKEICFKSGTVNIQAILEGAFVKFRYEIAETSKPFGLDEFKSWISNNALNDAIFSRTEIELFGIVPILTQLRTIIAEESKDKNVHNFVTVESPFFMNLFAWIAPIRAEPQRAYHHQGLIFDPEGSHTPSVLKDIMTGPDVKKILNRFGLDSGLYDDIEIKDLSDETGKSKPFELLVYINGEPRNIVNVGYGVSQILPIIIEAIARQNKTWFATQQHEVHLHPRAQAAFGDFIFKSNTLDEQKYIIETHSDYTIDRYRLRINRAFKEGRVKTKDLGQVVFFEKSEAGNSLEVIKFNEDGSYPEVQPKSFRDFFIREQLEIISI